MGGRIPEICEVEIIGRELNEIISHCTVEEVEQCDWYNDRRVRKNPKSDLRQLIGWSFSGVSRYGKALLFKLENPGIGNRYLASRLGMSGHWKIRTTDSEYKSKRGWVLALTLHHAQGRIVLSYSDLRTFGTLEVGESVQDLESLRIYGPEIFSNAFSVEWVKFVCSRHSVPIKALLLDQKYFAGVGNWVASEVLFKSHIHPSTPAKKLNLDEIKRLFYSIHLVINNGIHHGGASLMSWKRTSGEDGGAQETMSVYNRSGKECLICGGLIKRVKISGRSAFYCIVCQPENGWIAPDPVSNYTAKIISEVTMEVEDKFGI